ncbi:hypothetical protein [Actinotalea solisilvae]|uniref:hypothetical protein n=1 Tax=Actinotalea solisilvae TaxID=2072922 RepID=UPI0018F1B366|nr:hypothetical protein [Actinotalea solisilvae]
MHVATNASVAPGIHEEYGGPDQDPQTRQPFEVEWKGASNEVRVAAAARVVPLILAVVILLAGGYFWTIGGAAIGLSLIGIGEPVLYIFANKFIKN